MAIPTHTPAKNSFTLPNASLAKAIGEEWAAGRKYSPSSMPLTALAYTAIDQIALKKDSVIEALQVYIDTDTLSYRADGHEALAKEQEKKWGAVLKWMAARFDVAWQTTSGVMPAEQSPLLHAAVARYLQALDEWQLSAFCIFSSVFSSLALAIAVCEGHLDASGAFALSRLEEEAQATKWGRDVEADERAAKMKSEIVAAERFLHLLNKA